MWLELREGILDVLGRIPDRDVWQQIEIECDAGELIKMIHCLRTDNFLCGCYNTHRHEACHVTGSRGNRPTTRAAGAEIPTGAAPDIEVVQVPWVRALLVFHFKNDLVLVVGLLDEIDVIL